MDQYVLRWWGSMDGKGRGCQTEHAGSPAQRVPSITLKLTFKSGKFASARKADAVLTVNCTEPPYIMQPAHTRVLVTRRVQPANKGEKERDRGGKAKPDRWNRERGKRRERGHAKKERTQRRTSGPNGAGITLRRKKEKKSGEMKKERRPPSLLNVNVRHLLLRLYDPLFVCICGTSAVRRRWRRSRKRWRRKWWRWRTSRH